MRLREIVRSRRTFAIQYHTARRKVPLAMNEAFRTPLLPRIQKARLRKSAGLCYVAVKVTCGAAKTLLLDHPDFDFGVHVRMKTNRHAVHAERLDRLLQ